MDQKSRSKGIPATDGSEPSLWKIVVDTARPRHQAAIAKMVMAAPTFPHQQIITFLEENGYFQSVDFDCNFNAPRHHDFLQEPPQNLDLFAGDLPPPQEGAPPVQPASNTSNQSSNPVDEESFFAEDHLEHERDYMRLATLHTKQRTTAAPVVTSKKLLIGKPTAALAPKAVLPLSTSSKLPQSTSLTQPREFHFNSSKRKRDENAEPTKLTSEPPRRLVVPKPPTETKAFNLSTSKTKDSRPAPSQLTKISTSAKSSIVPRVPSTLSTATKSTTLPKVSSKPKITESKPLLTQPRTTTTTSTKPARTSSSLGLGLRQNISALSAQVSTMRSTKPPTIPSGPNLGTSRRAVDRAQLQNNRSEEEVKKFSSFERSAHPISGRQLPSASSSGSVSRKRSLTQAAVPLRDTSNEPPAERSAKRQKTTETPSIANKENYSGKISLLSSVKKLRSALTTPRSPLLSTKKRAQTRILNSQLQSEQKQKITTTTTTVLSEDKPLPVIPQPKQDFPLEQSSDIAAMNELFGIITPAKASYHPPTFDSTPSIAAQSRKKSAELRPLPAAE